MLQVAAFASTPLGDESARAGVKLGSSRCDVSRSPVFDASPLQQRILLPQLRLVHRPPLSLLDRAQSEQLLDQTDAALAFLSSPSWDAAAEALRGVRSCLTDVETAVGGTDLTGAQAVTSGVRIICRESATAVCQTSRRPHLVAPSDQHSEVWISLLRFAVSWHRSSASRRTSSQSSAQGRQRWAIPLSLRRGSQGC